MASERKLSDKNEPVIFVAEASSLPTSSAVAKPDPSYAAEWDIASIGDLAEQRPGALAVGPFGSRMKRDLYTTAGVRVIRGTNLTGGSRVSGEFVHVATSTADSMPSCCLKPGDLVFPHRGNIGEVGVTPDDGNRYMLSTSLMKMSPDRSRVYPNFLLYYFKSDAGRAALLMNASQVGTPGIATPLKSLRSIRLKLPELREQTSIAGVLESLDNRIELLRQTNATLEAIAHTLFKSWFVDFDPVHTKAEGREPDGMDAATAALFPSTFGDDKAIAATPTGWSSSALYDLAQFINGAAYKAFAPNAERRGLPIIKIAELKAGVTSQTAFSEVDMPLKYRIDSNDILFSWSGNPDTSIDTFVWSHGAAWLNQHIFRVVPNAPHERSFVLLTLKYLKSTFAEIARDKQTTGLGHVTVADLKRLRVVKPDMPLLKEWNKLVDPLIERAFVTQQQAQSLVQLRDTLLPRLISGKLRLPVAQTLIKEAIA